MSKRCCASMCFNSQTTNTKVTYFGFPKHAEYARSWATLARREDLLEKSLNNIIKYFLCSEHFTEDCFIDPPLNTKLRKTTRPVTVPLPSIFNCNIDQYIKTDPNAPMVQCSEQEKDTNSDSEEERQWIAMYDNVATTAKHNEIFYDDLGNPISESFQDEEADVLNKNTDQMNNNNESSLRHIHTTEATVDDESDESIYLPKTGSFDDLEVYCLDASIDVSPIYIDTNEISFHIEEPDDVDVEELQETTTEKRETVAGTDDRTDETVVPAPLKQNPTFNHMCRLCAQEFPPGNRLIRIFNVDNESLVDGLNMVLPNTISAGDGLPQQICFPCYTKVTNCVKTINSFKSAQELF